MRGKGVKQRLTIVRIVCLLILSIFVVFAIIGCGQAPSSPTNTKVEPIVFGVVTALGSIEGADSLRAVQLAAEEINAKGGVSVGGTKRPIEIVAADTREHEAGVPISDALAALEKVITEKKPHAIVSGAFRSEVLLATMDLIAKYKIPYICNIAMSPKFQEKFREDPEKYKYMFRMTLTSVDLGNYMTGLMEFLQKEFGFSRAYIITQDVLWAKGTGQVLEKWFNEHGWQVIAFDTYPTGASDFSASLSKAQAQKADILVPIFDMPQSGILVKQVKSMRLPALLAGSVSPMATEEAWEVYEGEIEGMTDVCYQVGPVPVKAVPKSLEFNQNYGKKWGEQMRRKLSHNGPGPSYDAVYVLVGAIERAGSLDPEAIVKALEQTDMMGVIGRIRFNQDHQVVYGNDPKETALGVVFQWKAPGVRVPVYPPVVAEGPIELPAFAKQ